MSKGRFIVKNRRKRKLYFSLLFVCLLVIGIGYANISTHLDILGLLGVRGVDVSPNTAWDYDYKKEIQIFIAPKDGIYRLEAWGSPRRRFCCHWR